MSNVGQQLLSGGLSGLTSVLCLQPFDLLKTRVQQGDGRVIARPQSAFSTARTIVAQDGVLGLWRGTGATLLRNVPGVALYMSGLTQLRTVMATSPYFARVRERTSSAESKNTVLPKLSSQGNLIAGATARVTVGFILNPFSVLKARYESNLYAYQSLTGSFLTIARLGPSELFRGFVASSLRDAPYAGFFVLFYESIKGRTSYLFPSSYAASIHTFSAASAGAIATIATHPFDVIKTKMQVRREDSYRNLSGTMWTIFKQRGVAGFLDGVSLRMTRKILSSAIGWAVYEGSLLFMKN